MDLGLDNNLDLKIVDGVYVGQVNGETTVINAFFTDSRVEAKRGYWLDVMSSELWTYEQTRLTQDVATELTETAREIADEMVKNGIYKRIDVEAYINDAVMTLRIKCYNDKGIVVDRKFTI